MKLISMTDFVLEQMEINSFDEDKIKNIWNYAKFLKQPLTLGMFVPCDDDGNVLEEPLHIELYEGDTYDLDCKFYKQAQSKVLFNGFEIKERSCSSAIFKYIENGFIAPFYFNINSQKFEENTDLKIIEDLIPYNLDLAVSF